MAGPLCPSCVVSRC